VVGAEARTATPEAWVKKAKVVATVAPGIYRLEDGSYRVVAHVGNSRLSQRRKEKRFAADTGIREMKRWQANTRAALSREKLRIRRDTLTADVPRYMTVMKRRLKHPDLREDEINAWLPAFGERRRDAIEGEEIRQQVLRWEGEGFAGSTINHRLSALSQLFEVLDGKKAYNPVLEIARMKEPKAKPGGKSPETIQKVFARARGASSEVQPGPQDSRQAQGDCSDRHAPFSGDAARI
jgi:hypothetical protein